MIGASARARHDRRRDPPQPPQRFQGPVYPVNPKAASPVGAAAYPLDRRVPGPGGPRGARGAGGARSGGARRLRRPGVKAVVVISAGFARPARRAPRAKRRCSTRCARRTACAWSAPTAWAWSTPSPPCASTRPSRRSFRRAGRVAFSSQSGALGLAILDYARAAQPRHLDVRLRRQQGRRLGQRPARVLGARPGHRRDPALPRELREPAPVLADRAPRRRARSRSSRSRPGARGRARAPRHRTPARSPESDAAVDALFRQAGVIRTDTHRGAVRRRDAARAPAGAEGRAWRS